MSPTNSVDIHRDMDNDILYVLRADAPKKTINIDAMPNVVMRIDPKSKRTVGLILHHFSQVAPDWNDIGEWRLMEIFDLFLDMINSGGKVPH